VNINSFNLRHSFFCFLVILFPLVLILKNFAINFYLFIFLFFFISEKFRKLIFRKEFILILIFYVFCILSSSLSNTPQNSLESSIPYIRFFIFAVGLSFIFLENKKYFNLFIYSIFFILSLIFIDSQIQYFRGFNILGLNI